METLLRMESLVVGVLKEPSHIVPGPRTIHKHLRPFIIVLYVLGAVSYVLHYIMVADLNVQYVRMYWLYALTVTVQSCVWVQYSLLYVVYVL